VYSGVFFDFNIMVLHGVYFVSSEMLSGSRLICLMILAGPMTVMPLLPPLRKSMTKFLSLDINRSSLLMSLADKEQISIPGNDLLTLSIVRLISIASSFGSNREFRIMIFLSLIRFSIMSTRSSSVALLKVSIGMKSSDSLLILLCSPQIVFHISC